MSEIWVVTAMQESPKVKAEDGGAKKSSFLVQQTSCKLWMEAVPMR